MTSYITILIASQNQGKLREFKEILNDWRQCNSAYPTTIELCCAPGEIEIDETGATFAENAALKANGYFSALSTLADDVEYILAEDSGLIVDALDGVGGLSPFPGVISKRWLTPELQGMAFGGPLETDVTQHHLNRAILQLLAHKPQHARPSRYCCAIALLDTKTGEVHESYDEMPLQVALESKGKGGFGYDPIMHPVSDSLVLPITVAELSPCLKNKLSHRGKAFRALLTRIASSASVIPAEPLLKQGDSRFRGNDG